VSGDLYGQQELFLPQIKNINLNRNLVNMMSRCLVNTVLEVRMRRRMRRRLETWRTGGKTNKETPTGAFIFYPKNAGRVPLIKAPHMEAHVPGHLPTCTHVPPALVLGCTTRVV